MIAQERFARLEAAPFVTSGPGQRGVIATIGAFVDIFRNRELLGLLVRRDLKARYKDSVLGFLWTLIRPLTQLAIYYLVVGKFLGAERGIPAFAIYIFVGLTVYGLFSEIITGGTLSIVNNSGLIKKVFLRREVFPLASVGGALVTFAVQLLILVAAILVIGPLPDVANLPLAIPSFLIVLTFGTALALVLSSINVYLRDVGYLVEVVLMVLLWASPIVYAWSMVRGVVGNGLLLDLYTSNPLTIAVLGFQRAFWNGGELAVFPGDLALRLWVTVVAGLVAVVIGQVVFARLQGNFAQQL